MSSVNRGLSQVPPFKRWYVTGTQVTFYNSTTGLALSPTTGLTTGTVLQDMGKTVVINNLNNNDAIILRKVIILPRTGATGVTGFIRLGDGVATKEYSVLN